MENEEAVSLLSSRQRQRERESSSFTQMSNRKAPKYSQRSTALEKEAQGFCTAVASGPIRSKAVTPTLDEITSQSFESYVRSILFDPVEWSDDDDEEEEDEESDEDDDARQSESKNNIQLPLSSSSSSSSPNQKNRLTNPRWNHGICKVTLPQGWWDQAGIANDTTARGTEVGKYSGHSTFVNSFPFIIHFSHTKNRFLVATWYTTRQLQSRRPY